MTTFNDLPASALSLITRFARKRYIPGTNRFARVCRRWRDAALGSEDQEQLHLLLELDAVPADALTSTSAWLAQHGQCVNSLYITYDDDPAPVFQQLPLSTAPLMHLARLEVDGPDSLVALAPALPQLVGLTHLGACIGLVPVFDSDDDVDDGDYELAVGMFSAGGMPLEEVPSLQQLCPWLKSLRLGIDSTIEEYQQVIAFVEELLPVGLQQLHIHNCSVDSNAAIPCDTLTSFTSLRSLTLDRTSGLNADLLLGMTGLEELQLWRVYGMVGQHFFPTEWLAAGACTTPQHLTKITGLSLNPMSPALDTLIAGPNNLRKLGLVLGIRELGAGLQQLSALTGLRHLSLKAMGLQQDVPEAALLALSSLQQLTYLSVSARPFNAPRSTWAAVLPHLTQLCVLGLTREQLAEEGVAAEVAGLPQLQCLYVEDDMLVVWGADNTVWHVAPHLQVLSSCGSLRAVLCWSDNPDAAPNLPMYMWEHVHQGRLHLSGWHKWRDAAVEGWVVCPQHCPHLPDVWELQQQEPVNG